MFVNRHRDLIKHVRREYDKGGPKVFEDVNSWQALLRILKNILQDPLLKRTYLIIDALDECTTGLNHLLRLIVEKSSCHSNVKWLVSSRNWPSIEQTLETATKREILCLELNEDSVSKAVASFIHYKVDSLTRDKKYSNDIRNAVIQHLIANAHGTFLWVALVCKELAKFSVSEGAFHKKVEKIPAGLDQLYQRMLDYIGDSEYAQLCISILRCVQNTKSKGGLREFLDNPDLKSIDGTVRLSSILLDGPNEHSLLTLSENRDSGFGTNGEFITWNSECLLWLPPDYRPRSGLSAVFSKSTVCISCASGRVLFFNLDTTKLLHTLATPEIGRVRS